MHLIKVYFRHRIITLAFNWKNILMKISENILLRKIELSERFPRKMLYARKLSLGIGLIRPLSIVAILLSKSHTGYVRA